MEFGLSKRRQFVFIVFILSIALHVETIFRREHKDFSNLTYSYYLWTKLPPIWLAVLTSFWFRDVSDGVSNGYFWSIISGIAISNVGDYFLCSLESEPTEVMKKLGIAAFLVTQTLYSFAFTFGREKKGLKLLRSIPFILFGFGIFYVLYPGIPADLVIPVAVYVVVVCAMGWRATALLHSRVKADHKDEQDALDSMRSQEILAFIGAVTFIISDAILAFGWFVYAFPYFRVFNMITYYLAQWFIAGSVQITGESMVGTLTVTGKQRDFRVPSALQMSEKEIGVEGYMDSDSG